VGASQAPASLRTEDPADDDARQSAASDPANASSRVQRQYQVQRQDRERKGKASKPTEFGKLVKIQEAENQIITHYEVYDERPSDASLLVDAVEKHHQQTGRVPHTVAADSGFYTQANEKQLEAAGVKRVSIPNRKTRSSERRARQKQRWFKKGQRWRTGCEGRISVLKRRHGLQRCLYRGPEGMKRWVGLGIIADNLINIGHHLASALR
jgi:transposase, IS5 family